MTYKAIIVSDLHLGTEDSKTKEFLDFLHTHKTELLILNGDIVDGWALDRGSKWKKRHTAVIQELLKLSCRIPVVWLPGNHDEFLRDIVPFTIGNIQLAEEYEYTSPSGLRYLIFHGDVLDIFTSRFKWIGKIGSIGYNWLLWMNTLYNQYRKWRGLPYFSLSKKIKQNVKSAVSFIEDFEENAVRLAKDRNFDGVICGHIHKHEHRMLNETHYINSGDWVESMTAILIDEEGRITFYEHR